VCHFPTAEFEGESTATVKFYYCYFTQIISGKNNLHPANELIQIAVTVLNGSSSKPITNSAHLANCQPQISDLGNKTFRKLCVKIEPVISQDEHNFSNCNVNGAGLFLKETGIWSLLGIYSQQTYPGKTTAADSNCSGQKIFTDLSRMKGWIDKELGREPPVYDLDGTEANTAPAPTPSAIPTSTYSSTRLPNHPAWGPKHKEREPLTPEPFLISHHPISRPIDAEIFPEDLQEDKEHRRITSKSHAPEPTTETPTTAHHSSKRHSHVTPFYGVLPTRFPLTSKPKSSTSLHVDRKSTSTTTEVDDLRDHTPVYDGNGSKDLKCPPLERPPVVSLVCKGCCFISYHNFLLCKCRE